jgi:putative glutathione S-transferase
MGQLVDGVWQDVWYDTNPPEDANAPFRPSVTGFTADGAPGPSG